MSSLIFVADALAGVRPSAPPVVPRPAATPRWPATAIKKAAGYKFVSAGQALLAAQAAAADARRALMRASMDRLANQDRSGDRDQERRLARDVAARRVAEADGAVQLMHTRFDAAVREFYAA